MGRRFLRLVYGPGDCNHSVVMTAARLWAKYQPGYGPNIRQVMDYDWLFSVHRPKISQVMGQRSARLPSGCDWNI